LKGVLNVFPLDGEFLFLAGDSGESGFEFCFLGGQ
jgi:hypothetical protein